MTIRTMFGGVVGAGGAELGEASAERTGMGVPGAGVPVVAAPTGAHGRSDAAGVAGSGRPAGGGTVVGQARARRQPA